MAYKQELCEFHRMKVMNAIRFLALDYPEQDALRPSFASLEQFVEEAVNDPVVHALAFERSSRTSAFSEDERVGLRQLREQLSSIGEAHDTDGSSNSPDTDIIVRLRETARALIKQFGWEGVVDAHHL